MQKGQQWLMVGIWLVFITTRIFIWNHPPQEFTQIIYVYMPYAHLWASGELPYLKQWYEYPPLTIPFFYLPHLIDTATNHHWYHLNYSDAYKLILTLIDTLSFGLIWITLKKLKVSKINLGLSLIYYSLITAKAHDFIYDSFDLLFSAGMIFTVVAPILWQKRGTLIGWIGYMSALALKYVNLPLGLPGLIIQRQRWKKQIFELMLAGIIIWGIPVVIFRSSLLVTLEYHKQRGLQIESFPATIVRTIDVNTHTEEVKEVSKAYDITGPISDQVAKIFRIIFPLSLSGYIGYLSWVLWRSEKELSSQVLIWGTLGYISVFMVTSTVLSTPYLLWHIPFVALLPAHKLGQKIRLMLLSMIAVVAGMTYFPNVQVGSLTTHIWIGWIKTISFGLISILVIGQLKTYGQRRLAK